MRRAVKCSPPTTTTSSMGMVKNAIRKGMMAFLDGRTKISATARSRHTIMNGLMIESAAPPPKSKMFWAPAWIRLRPLGLLAGLRAGTLQATFTCCRGQLGPNQ